MFTVMNTIIGISILSIIIIFAMIVMKRRMGNTNPDKEIEENYNNRMMSRYK
ncbi:MAG: hypothetical protein GY754_28810 [bacterium]|nr:hypothetical protein [bacterium]